MPYQKITLIFNPIANLGRAAAEAATLRPILEEHPHARWQNTQFHGHATQLAQAAAQEGCDLVIAVGGDGTVHEVVNGLMQLPPPLRPTLGVVPLGSGNDFSFSLGLPGEPAEALRQVLAGSPHPVDIGWLSDDRNRAEYFSNTVGIGFDAIVVIHSRKVRLLQGFAVYLLAVLRTLLFNHHPFLLQMQTPDHSWEESLLMLAVCNGQREGGGFHLVPGGQNDDGWLDTVALLRISRSKLLLNTLLPFLKGTHTTLPHVRMGKVQQLSLQSDIPLIIHTDGEIFAGFDSAVHHLRFEIYPGALQASV